MRNLSLIILVLSMFLLAATSPMQKKLIGVWKIQVMEIKGTKIRHQEIGQPYIEFNDEGGFMIKIGSSAEKGRYTVKGNDIRLKFLLPKKPAQKMTITRLDDTELDYTTSDTTGQVNVKCFRIIMGQDGDKK